MGKATRWLKSLIGIKRSSSATTNSTHDTPPSSGKDTHKRRWGFVKSYREKSSTSQKSTRKELRDNHTPSATTTTSGYLDRSNTASVDANKHAMEVAAATAAVAEAAVAAAQAAAAVVRLTSSGRCNNNTGDGSVSGGCGSGSVSGGCVGGRGMRHVWAAVVIQSHFRGYLARRALRALKGLVRLQALVRGHIMRKRTAEDMRCMQAMLRAQTRARAVRSYPSDSPSSSSKSSSQIHHQGPPTPEKFELLDVRPKAMNHDQSPLLKRNSPRSNSRVSLNRDKPNNLSSSCWSDPLMDESTWVQRGHAVKHSFTGDERADRILEIDTGKSKFQQPRRRNLRESHQFASASDQMSHSYTTSRDSHPTVTSPEIQSLNPLKLSSHRHHHPEEVDDDHFCTAENSPHLYSATSSRGGSSRRGPFTPAKSDGSMSFLSGFSDCPSYMAYTESSRAKMRSLSAPKQRPGYEGSYSSTKRYSVHGLGDARATSSYSNSQKIAAAMHANFASKAYPGSGHLDRLGMPLRSSSTQQLVYYSGYLN